MAASRRVIIDHVTPSVDGGRFAVKRTVGDRLVIEADIFADGHEQLAAFVATRPGASAESALTPMKPLGNDRWRAVVELRDTTPLDFRIEAWLDHYGGFVRDTGRKRAAGLALGLEAQEGQALLEEAAHAVSDLKPIAEGLAKAGEAERIETLLAPETVRLMSRADTRPFLVTSFTQRVEVDRKAASFASWYELFPRSQGVEAGRHGTFRDVIRQLPRIRDMGFDVLYMPPIHPVGLKNRKGRNNSLRAEAGDPGSVYAIGSQAGGHDAVHPELGTLEDFRALVAAAKEHDLELALDFAVQMSPDHPWLKEHAGWYQRRPDGSIKYAENPPKKYEDIVNPDFYSDPALWEALRDVLLHWGKQGVRIFRVDNPHTKPMPFWEWLIAEVKAVYPGTIFLAEAFTRPNPMYHLAKLGYTQSYTYFTWRNSKRELTEFLTELTATPVKEFYRPNFFVNTPDINPPFLQTGGRPAFLIRAALAATLSGLWGIYSGFEICEAEPLPGREEYQDSEKYELKHRNFDAPGNIADEIMALNKLRRMEPALQSHLGLRFYNAFNDQILYCAKTVPDADYMVLVAVNLDPFRTQECEIEVPLWEWGLPDHEIMEVEDLLHGYRFAWAGKIQHLRLEPSKPYAIWRIRPRKDVPLKEPE